MARATANEMSSTRHALWRPALAAAATLMLVACGGDMSDLRSYVKEVESRQHGEVEPLPEIEPYETFEYSAVDLRDPFEAQRFGRQQATEGEGGASSVKPDTDRPSEALEAYPLDSLRMVGTLSQDQQLWALVKTPNGTVHRVLPGNHMGQNYGEIVDVTHNEIKLKEVVPDGMGGWRERQASLALSTQS